MPSIPHLKTPKLIVLTWSTSGWSMAASTTHSYTKVHSYYHGIMVHKIKRYWQLYRSFFLNGYYLCSFRVYHTHIPIHRIAQGYMTHTFLSRVLPTVLQSDKNNVSCIQLCKNLCLKNQKNLTFFLFESPHFYESGIYVR